MYEHLIVAVDGDEAGRAALEWAMTRTHGPEDDIEITSVLALDASDAARHARTLTLDEAAARVQARVRHAKVSTTLRHGEVETELVRASARADLMVIGSDAREHGWVANQSTLPLRLAPRVECALIVVPKGYTPGPGPVIVGSEAVEAPEPAVEFAVAEAIRMQRPLVIAHGWEVSSTAAIGDFGGSFDVLAETARDLLENVVQATRVRHPAVAASGMLIQAPVAGGLVGAGRDATLLVVGNRGRGALASIMLGSVSRDVLAALPCPVAVVPNATVRDLLDRRSPHAGALLLP